MDSTGPLEEDLAATPTLTLVTIMLDVTAEEALEEEALVVEALEAGVTSMEEAFQVGAKDHLRSSFTNTTLIVTTVQSALHQIVISAIGMNTPMTTSITTNRIQGMVITNIDNQWPFEKGSLRQHHLQMKRRKQNTTTYPYQRVW